MSSSMLIRFLLCFILMHLRRLTFDATIAELTSLEEMLRAMMDDGQIPPEVIKRLWQVYSMCIFFFPFVCTGSERLYQVPKRRFLDNNVEALLSS
jgi:hypothetical protein